MNLLRAQPQETIDFSADTVIKSLVESVSEGPIKSSVVSLLFYGSRLFGSETSDYDTDLVLKTFNQTDFNAIKRMLDTAKQHTSATIDFEVYYYDLLHLDSRFTTGDQGCYFLYSWATAAVIYGSNDAYKEAVNALDDKLLSRDLDRKVHNYFGRIRHTLVNEDEHNWREIRKNFARAIYHSNLLTGEYGYERVFGYSSDSILRRELSEGSLCAGGLTTFLLKLLEGELTVEDTFTFLNMLHRKYLSVTRELV